MFDHSQPSHLSFKCPTSTYKSVYVEPACGLSKTKEREKGKNASGIMPPMPEFIRPKNSFRQRSQSSLTIKVLNECSER